jgi:ubiquinone biosynthesis protein COQ4
MKNSDHYFMRGVSTVASTSSLLVSSSKYLNHARLRDWVAMISLRRNGPDFPAPAELVEVIEIMEELRDLDRIEHLFTEERKTNPRLDVWLAESFMSPRTTLDDYARYESGTPGGILYAQFFGKYEVEFTSNQWDPATSQWDFFWRREVQMHDLEHILLGGTVDALGELVPSYFRMTNIPRFIRNQELAGELLAYKIFASMRYVQRTMLHYPQVWTYCLDAINRGVTAGMASGPLFMARLEPVLGLPLDEARAALGLKAVVDRDTTLASAFWSEETDTPPPGLFSDLD